MTYRAGRQEKTPGAPRWRLRLGGWLCLVAILLGQAYLPVTAWAASNTFLDPGAICHAGDPGQAPAQPDTPFSDCCHCPLCHMMAHAAFTAPSPVGFAAPLLPPVVLGRIATASPPVVGMAEGGPLQPRAPPVAG